MEVLHFLFGIELLGGPEVDDLEGSVRKHDVFGLEVPVDDLLFVKIVDCEENFLEHLLRVLFSEGRTLLDLVEEFSSLNQLCRNVDEFLVVKVLVGTHNIGVVQRGKNLYFLEELLGSLL